MSIAADKARVGQVMVTKAKPVNPVDYLESDSDIAEALAEIYGDDDFAVFITALGHVVRHKEYATLAQVLV